MKIHQLKKLIAEVLREVEAEVEDPKANSVPSGPPGLKHSGEHEKEYGQMRDTFLKLKLGGINKNNSHIIRDFIAQAAHAAKMADLEVIHAELEKDGKIGLELSGGEIKKSEEEINAELDAMSANDAPELDPNTGMPSRAAWKRMSPEQRDKYVKKGSHKDEWDAATDKDVEDTRKKTALKAAKIKSGTYDPNDTSLWTDKEWDAWNAGGEQAQTYDKGKMAGKYKPNLSKGTAQGARGAVSGDFTNRLRH